MHESYLFARTRNLGHSARVTCFQYALSNVPGVASMFRAFSVFGRVAAAHASEILRECAWPSVCEPVSATRCFMPAHWHSLKNGMVVTMSRTLWLCGAGSTKVWSAL